MIVTDGEKYGGMHNGPDEWAGQASLFSPSSHWSQYASNNMANILLHVHLSLWFKKSLLYQYQAVSESTSLSVWCYVERRRVDVEDVLGWCFRTFWLDWHDPCIVQMFKNLTDIFIYIPNTTILRETITNHYVRYGVEEIKCDDTLQRDWCPRKWA